MNSKNEQCESCLDPNSEDTQILNPRIKSDSSKLQTKAGASSDSAGARYTDGIDVSMAGTQVLNPRYRFKKNEVTTRERKGNSASEALNIEEESATPVK